MGGEYNFPCSPAGAMFFKGILEAKSNTNTPR